MTNHKLLFSLTKAKKSAPKKAKQSLESSSDDEAVVSKAPRAVQSKVRELSSLILVFAMPALEIGRGREGVLSPPLLSGE